MGGRGRGRREVVGRIGLEARAERRKTMDGCRRHPGGCKEKDGRKGGANRSRKKEAAASSLLSSVFYSFRGEAALFGFFFFFALAAPAAAAPAALRKSHQSIKLPVLPFT